ncbi:hypothetical protein HHK36_003944 [Tetracentron sinense]|uniref:EF-hand domain-containing protein n=1 Tax=Tetracentron sinense TaxID=13715 RepID=A0A834ZPY8_TETSI|nr:hypothetical protein HHK36_003944 [Tetracentron sinense]
MATTSVSKPSKWFSNKTLKLTLPHRTRSKSDSPLFPTSSLPPKDGTREDELRQVLKHLDSDGDGKISTEELKAYFASVGEDMSHDEAQGLISDLDRDGDNLLDFEDFVRLMERDEEDEDLRRAFEMYEVEKGSGFITPKGLQRMLNRLGDPKSHEECVAMIKVFDLDGNGVLDFHEFHQMMA